MVICTSICQCSCSVCMKRKKVTTSLYFFCRLLWKSPWSNIVSGRVARTSNTLHCSVDLLMENKTYKDRWGLGSSVLTPCTVAATTLCCGLKKQSVLDSWCQRGITLVRSLLVVLVCLSLWSYLSLFWHLHSFSEFAPCFWSWRINLCPPPPSLFHCCSF